MKLFDNYCCEMLKNKFQNNVDETYQTQFFQMETPHFEKLILLKFNIGVTLSKLVYLKNY